MMGLVSNNPLLANITDYLIEEASAEEEELLGNKNTDLEEGEEGDDANTIVRDEELIKVLVSYVIGAHVNTHSTLLPILEMIL
jgi:hypothetical protein